MAVRVDLSSAGVAAVLRSAPVQAAVNAAAERVAATARNAGIMVEGEPGDVPLPVTVEEAGGTRARARVVLDHPAGMAVEAKHRLLGGSV